MTKVFISYRHENNAHCYCVRQFALRLRQRGVDVVLDELANEEQFNHGGPPEGWATWSKRQARDAPRVLIIASAGWFACYEKKQAPGAGLGAAAEAHVIEERLNEAGQVLEFARIVHFDDASREAICIGLRTYQKFDADRDFYAVVTWLTGGKGKVAADPIPDPTGWLAAAPELDWSIADCDEVRSAFAALLVETSPHRVLLITGPSEVGKTRLTYYLRDLVTRKQQWLACGRFDLKGGTSLEAAFSDFITNLDVGKAAAATDGRPLRQRLDAVLEALRDRARPTLLIFDAFDMSSEVAVWLKEKALVLVPRASWLRLMIVGQQIPMPRGTAWVDVAAPPISLLRPTWQDWYRYGRQLDNNLEEEFVRKLFDKAKGAPSMLAQILGNAAA